MREVHPNLWVGNAEDEAAVRDNPDWYVISAAKDPWHRKALGYTGRSAPKDDNEYFYAYRPRRLILNLVDAPDAAYIPEHVIHLAIGEIIQMVDHTKVLIHCNQGQSRSPTIAMLFLRERTDLFDGLDFDMATEKFKSIYPAFEPSKGMADYARQHWTKAEVDA